MKDNVRVVECVSKMNKVMNGSGFAVTSAMAYHNFSTKHTLPDEYYCLKYVKPLVLTLNM